MTFTGAMTILMYALAPFAWLIAGGVAIFLAIHLFAYLRGYQFSQHHSIVAMLLALALGLSALFWIPWFTNSELGYVDTVFDWVAIIGGVIATMVITFFTVHPLSYLLIEKRE
ncbi:MAG: hypothetical protein FMJ08_04220 [Halomonas sp.]|nr:hypothetical protein [Halomonas sp.]TVM07014.1 MAG: hypothetical protein FMJ08_04220 [Halomonas sp.]